MPWQIPWPEFLKKRLCRYLLQHYLGHFFKEKISLEQLSIDIYNGTGCVKNLNLDCDALNEQLNSSSSSSSFSSSSSSSVPIEIVSGFVGYISVYIPWHDLFNDYCKLTIKNVQITIRTKQRKQNSSSSQNQNFFTRTFSRGGGGGEDGEFGSGSMFSDESDSNSNSMFSSTILDSIMNTSMHIAQECLNEEPSANEYFTNNDKNSNGKNLNSDSSKSATNNSLLGLEAFASTIDSILSRIKINLEQIQIRIENIENDKPSADLMSSSTIFQNRPSNGIALELRIKSIKYFDLDSTSNTSKDQSTNNSLDPNSNASLQQQQQQQNLIRNTTKSFNIEGLTVYFDEFIIRDDFDPNNSQDKAKKMTESSLSKEGTETNSLNSTIDLNDGNSTIGDLDQSSNYYAHTVNSTSSNTTVTSMPIDECPPFNFELNPDYYLYTNPIIMLTFSGIQSIKLTINDLRPTDMIMEAASTTGPDLNAKFNQQIKNQQRPFLEVNAQFGAIKCLLCPKQIHLLTEMITRLNDYIEAANSTKRTLKLMHQKKKSLNKLAKSNNKVKTKPVRGCDKRKFESLLQNDLVFNPNADYLEVEEEDDEILENYDINDNFKSILHTDPNEASSMFYSMMSESTLNSNQSYSNMNNSNISGKESENENDTTSTSTNEQDEDKAQVLFTKNLKQTIEQLQTDPIKQSNSLAPNQNNQHNLFQTFKITVRQFSLTVLHHDPPLLTESQSNELNRQKNLFQYNSTKRLIVERMKQISDGYFDWVSTIDTSSTASCTQSSSARIEKNIVLKYHQACAFNDHFLVLFKPINLNLIQKINQRNIAKSSSIHYSLNDVTLTVGYIQVDEYLIPNEFETAKKAKSEKNSNIRRFKSSQAIETCHSATITELVHFVDSNTQTLQIEQPCLKAQLIFFDPLEFTTNSKIKSNNKYNSKSMNNDNYLLNRSFENIYVQLNQSLVFELDISIIDRLYYLINDISKVNCNTGQNQHSSKPVVVHNQNQTSPKIRNFEIKCFQCVKLGVRFPIADLRRAQQPKTFFTKSNEMTSSALNVSSSNQPILKPVTMIAFRNLREQILTLHIFDLTFQTLSNAPCHTTTSSDLLLTITSSQINAYYQYSKKERPIHFGLIQQKQNENRSLIFSIKIPIDNNTDLLNEDSQLLNDELFTLNTLENQPNTEMDSLKHVYNINVSKANRFTHRNNQPIKEENENENEHLKILNENENNINENQEEDEDDDENETNYGPFSRIHSLISSEKNRRIVNAGNKNEMNTFVNESKSNSQMTIKLNLPDFKLLIADQKFLNDIYNCFLNDLIMWVPTQLPPIESSLHIYDPVNNCFIAPSLNYLIESNLDTEFFFSNAHINLQTNFSDQENDFNDDDKQFHMCKSAILKSTSSARNSDKESNSSSEECCESDNDASKRKYKEKFDAKAKITKQNLKITKKKSPQNLLCLILKIESAHLKAFVLNNNLSNNSTPSSHINSNNIKPSQPLKYGEFDIKANNFLMCLSTSESYKTEASLTCKKGKNNNNNQSKKPKPQKQDSKTNDQENNKIRIEKQYICIYTDQINISQATKTCPANVNQLKYPTNYATFDSLFQMSKTKDLITSNDPAVSQCLFNTNQANLNMSASNTDSLISVPMVSIGIKSKFNSKTNKKQLLVALNFNSLTLHHTFCAQTDFWIFQLIELFNLIDIEVIGYQGPIVLTELHLNVSNSCIVYKPTYLPTRSLIAFKSLHWSSNVTAESSLTLLVFNIEDIYLFLSKPVVNDSQKIEETSINLKKDYVCVANTDLFELRLLISDEQAKTDKKPEPRKSPLLDIKLRSNVIQFRTCVDSAFALIELINYIVSDGDLHQVNPIMSEFMSSQPSSLNHTVQINPTLDSKQQHQTVIDELNSAIGITKAINIATYSNPIESPATFTVGTPPPSSSFKSSSSSASLSQQQFYSPLKNNSLSSGHMSTAASSFQDTQSISKTQPISVPSLSYDLKTIASSGNNISKLNNSSSAESIISDMVKEAMCSNPMMQSIYGSLDSEPSYSINALKEKQTINNNLISGGRKRNTSLTLDLQTKRMLSHDESCETGLEEDELVQSNLTNKTLKEKSLNDNNYDEFGDLLVKNDEKMPIKLFGMTHDEDEKENKSYLLDDDEDNDENLVNSIGINRLKQEDDAFQFDMPFSDSSSNSPLSLEKNKKSTLSSSSFSYSSLMSADVEQQNQQQNKLRTTQSSSKLGSHNVQRQLKFDKNNRKLFFKSKTEEDADENYNYNEDENDDDDDYLIRDFDVIDVIPGFGEPPRNNQEYEIKFLKSQQQGSNKQIKYTKLASSSHVIEIKEDHFKKPLTKIDVLKAPDTYPCPLNVYCVQEISINWFLYGGNDFSLSTQSTDFNNSTDESNLNDSIKSQSQKTPMSRTSSSPIMVNAMSQPSSLVSVSPSNLPSIRSRHNSTSSASLSVSPHSLNQQYFQSPPKQQQQQQQNQFSNQSISSSPSSQITINQSTKYTSKSTSISFSKEKYLPRKAGGRIIKKYDNLNWLTRGGNGRNLDVCMEIALHKVKTKIDLYTDLTELNDNPNVQDQNKKSIDNEEDSPYLYRIALAIGDVEVRDKLASSSFNMFLFRYESEQCPKHTNSNMIFFKFLCSKSMDAQRLLECDIKLSVQPLRFNIDQDALIFLIEFFQKLASKDLNEFSKTLVPPPTPPPPQHLPSQSSLSASMSSLSDKTSGFESSGESRSLQQSPQQIFIRNFILAPDLLIKFDFSGKYDKRPDTKMDTLTKLLMVVVQLSNTEIKLKRVYYRRGFLGAEKLFQALIKEWVSDIQRNQMKNLIKGWGIFNSLIQFFEGFTYLIWYPIEQYRRDGRVLCGIQKGSAAFSTCTVLATIELTNRMFQATKNIAEFFYDLVTPHRSNLNQHMIGYSGTVTSSTLVDTLFTGVGTHRNIRIRRQPNDIREGLTNAYYVMYEGINDTAANIMHEINTGAEHKGIPGAIGGVLRQLPSAAIAPFLLTSEATCNILSGIKNQLKPDEKKDDDQKWKTITYN